MASAGNAAAKFDISDLIDNRTIGSFQTRLFVLCGACLIMTGFCAQGMGFVGPEVIREMGITPAELGRILAAGNFGFLIGSLVFTVAGDKFGRRPVLTGATLFFAVMTIMVARSRTPDELLMLRFIAGLGLGSIMPNATALIGEYSPKKLRITLMMTITVGFTAGAAAGGFLAAWLMPNFGWRSVFYFGGAVPALIGVLMIFWLPESLQFLALKGRRETLARWLNRIDPRSGVDSRTQYVVSEESKAGVPIKHLFGDGRAPATTLYWIVNFTNLLNLFFLSGLLPTVLTRVGYDTSTSAVAGAILQTGGTIGTFVLAWLIARKGFTFVLTASFAIACVSVALIGSGPVLGAVSPLLIVVFIAGACIIGGQPGLNAMAATYYPTYMRSTGVGWGLGIGRIGAIVGPYFGGMLMGLQWTNQSLFLLFAVPALISTLIMIGLRFTMDAPPVPAGRAAAAK
jgi:AAHS family 4-hydroxybenzoate transporter-like MFS transporter